MRCGADLVAVGVAQVGAEQARQAVDEVPAPVVDDLAALAANDHLRPGFGVATHVGEVEEQVVARLAARVAAGRPFVTL